ncbi:hypothetical protein R1sor_005914 [Riccia sorocarpa]|uniref:Uncharacterized protein n=1 Tax=Riccia sorocarpa TaxID=122646 RepID=A0ABD3HLK0_9MARC
MKSIFDLYVNPSNKSDLQPLSVGLDRPELDADEYLQHVPLATSDYEVTPNRQIGSDYLEEIGDRTHARLRCETSIRGNGPTTHAQSRPLFAHAEEPAEPQPQEPAPVEIPMEEAVEEIQTPSTEPTVHEDVGSIQAEVAGEDVQSSPMQSNDHAAEEPAEPQPQEPAPVEIPMEEAGEDIQTLSIEPMVHEEVASIEPTMDVASIEPTMDVGSIQAEVAGEDVEDIHIPSTEPTGHEDPSIYTVEDPDVQDIAGPSSLGLHMQLTKEDLESTNPRRFMRGDVINMYIKEKFLVEPRSELYGKFFVNTFWFARLNALQEKIQSGKPEGVVNKIHRLRKGISPIVDDVQVIHYGAMFT